MSKTEIYFILNALFQLSSMVAPSAMAARAHSNIGGSSNDFQTRVCKTAANAAVLARIPDWLRPVPSDIRNLGNGVLEVTIATETQECYENHWVSTQIVNSGGNRGPTCKVLQVNYKNRQCD